MGNSKLMVRKKLGLIFLNDEQWIGGTYYTINLVNALNYLEDYKKPEIIVLSNLLDFQKLRIETNYPYLVFEDFEKSNYTKCEKFINRISIQIFNRKIVKKKYHQEIDAFFIMQRSDYLESIPSEKRIYWIPDFQDKYYPHFFDKNGLAKKHERSLWIHQNAKNLFFSSESVKGDWEKFYPDFNGNISVVHFAVTHPEFESLNIDELSQKYNLPNKYFFAPNQFWAHKNHMVAIKAAEILKNQGESVVIAFSGKENDIRNPGYTESLKEYVLEKKLDEVVKFLGFLDRREQLKIMKQSIAVIQPSRFEGWSTVIEDAMAMNQPVIASDLEVNKEQLGEKGWYFGVDSPNELAERMILMKENKTIVEYDYQSKLKAFANGFYSLIQSK